jgi:hypothetical protein
MPLSSLAFLIPMTLIHHQHYSERVPDIATRPRGVATRARASVDVESQAFGALMTAAVTGPLSADDEWSAFDLDSSTLRRMSPTRLLELLTDLSPEVSKALWDFLRFCNPGFEATAMRPTGKLKSTGAHQQALDDFLSVLKNRYGSVDIIIGRLFMSAFLRGALMAELVLSQDARVPLDIATPDPATARWKQLDDPDLGIVWQLGQWQRGGFVALDRETIRYLPIDPFPGHPEGRAIAGPALFSSVFLLAMLHDIRRVVQQQGYPRIDISVLMERVIASMPSQDAADPAKQQAWVDDTISQIETTYGALEPDQAYIHTDDTVINRPVGTLGADSLGAIPMVIEALERMITRALKSMPLLMATNQSTTETQATRSWEIHVAGIKAIQHLCEGLLEHLCTLALRAQGIPAVVQWRFAELRAAEMQRDATTEGLRIKNEREKHAAGWTSQDEASNAITGHKADQEEPRSSAGASPLAAIDAGDTGANP